MKNVRTQYSKHPRYYCAEGSHFGDRYVLEYNDKGEEVLINYHDDPVYDDIQSHAESTDLRTLIARYQTGDINALGNMKQNGMLCDTTQYPKTLPEFLKLKQKAENFFSSLPVEEREKYNHDPIQFLNEYGKEIFDHTVKQFVNTESEVKPDAES